jgi:hypothetical protein
VPAPVFRISALRRPHPVLIPRRGFAGLGAVQVLPASTVQTIAGTIQNVEGYYPGSLAYSNNNPGNLIYAGQAGATLGAGGFARFSTYQDGLDALNNQIQLYAGRGLTIQQMMNIYAPASDGNNPGAYATQVAGALGVSPDTSLTDLAGGGAPVYAAADLSAFGLPASIDPTVLAIGGAVAGLVLYGLFS